MDATPFPDIKFSCPGDCPESVHEAANLLMTAAVNNGGVLLKIIVERAGISDSEWRNRVRDLTEAHFPDHKISTLQTGLSGDRPLTLIRRERS